MFLFSCFDATAPKRFKTPLNSYKTLTLHRFLLSTCQSVDSLHVVGVEHLEGTAGTLEVAAALARHLANFLIGDVLADEFLDIDGHADGVVEALSGLNAFLGSGLGVGEVVGNVHHVDGVADETAQTLGMDCLSVGA